MRRVFVICSILLCVGLFFWTPTLVQGFFGNKYVGAETTIRLMALISGIFMLNQYLLYSVLANKLEKNYTWYIFIATLIQISVDLALIPRLGIIGAALGMLVIGIILHLGQVGLLWRQDILERSEVLRLELFLACSFGITLAVWIASPILIFNTFLVWLIVGLLGSFVLLEQPDRVQLWHWCRYQVQSLAAYYTAKVSGSSGG